MEELEKILRLHAARYRLMQPADAVKLIYQNEFGGGHLIRDGEDVLRYLRKEYEAVEKTSAAPQQEPIGNGLVRVYLPALTPQELEQLGQDFIRSASLHKGSLQQFCEKLSVLRHLAQQGTFPFSSEQLEQYLDEYAQKGYPMVSHSEAYRRAYKPAYRIIFTGENNR